jgi:hypothetical protein
MTTGQRIQFNDSAQSAIIKLADGNPGAVTAICCMTKAAAGVDPDNALGSASPIFSLDSNGIYGPRIWMLYKDVCDHNERHALALLRAVQLGLLSDEVLDHAIDHYGDGLNIPEVLAKVLERLPNSRFHVEPTTA